MLEKQYIIKANNVKGQRNVVDETRTEWNLLKAEMIDMWGVVKKSEELAVVSSTSMY